MRLGSWRKTANTGRVAQDVCAALDIENASKAVSDMEERLKNAGIFDPVSSLIKLKICDVTGSYITSDTISNGIKSRARKTQEFLCVNESGLNELIFASRKEEAVKFRWWVAHEVLPPLREAAGYEQYKMKCLVYKCVFRLSFEQFQKRIDDNIPPNIVSFSCL